MTPHDVLIENRRRLQWTFRWRDRCLTIALWGPWWVPVDTIRHLFANESALCTAFAADLAQVMSVAAVTVIAMIAWGIYDRRHDWSPTDHEELAARPRRGVLRRTRQTGPHAPIALGREACRGAGRRVTGPGSVLAMGNAQPDWPPPCTRG
jgi:hypothetical protein